MGSYSFWFYGKDDKGRPLDANILKAAEQIAPTLARYREHEVGCDSTINTLLQSAIEAASRAKRTKPIDNPIGYLTFSYKRIVDRFLHRGQKIVSVDDTRLGDLSDAQGNTSFEDEIHLRLFLEKVIESMDSDTRQIFDWRFRGYSMKKIAKELCITPNTLSARYMRGVKRAIKQVSKDG
jgi:RNA polymerase sigma factor (sigma-70 family)